MYAISRVYQEEQPFVVQRRAPLPPSTHVQLRPVPPTPRRAPQSPAMDQRKHPSLCACDACQPTVPMYQRQAQGSCYSTKTRRSRFVYESLPNHQPFPGAEPGDLRTVLVPTILQRLRASIEAHPFIWLCVARVLDLF
jgi:hypothetical protein